MPSPDTSERRSASGRRGPPLFLWLALAIGVGFLGLFGFLSVRSVRDGLFARDDGWAAARANGRWIVATVNPAGPAAAGLTPGDQIVALDGDARAARIGPAWQLADFVPGQQYRLTVRHGDTDVTADLAAGGRPDPGFATWIVLYLTVALISYGVGMMVAIVKPEDRTVQYAFATQLLTAVFMLWLAQRPVDGIHRDGVGLTLGLVFPFYLVTGYLFFARFPRPVPATRRWAAVTRTVVLGGLAIWLSRNSVTLLRALPRDQRLDLVDHAYPVVRVLQVGGLLPDLLFVVGAFIAMFAVWRRNYRLLPEGNDRRRLRVTAWGLGLAFVPAFVSAAAGVAATLAGAGPAVIHAVDVGKKVANGLTIAAPLSFGYAIIKHRVLGFRVAVRIGIQYILAQNALRTAVLLPVLWLGYTALMHPDRTVGQILFAGFGKLNLAVILIAGLGLQYRTQVSEAIDHRFFRAAYDQEAILQRLIDSVKQADSIAEIAGMASREIDAALRVARVLVFYHDPRAGTFSIGYSTQAENPSHVPLSEESPLLHEVSRTGDARTVDELRARATPRETEWLDGLQIELVVPLMGIDQNLIGLLMVGEKRSEEPFTSKDRLLLQAVAAQIGSVHEVLTLREKVGRQHEIQTEVLARFDERRINLVKECPSCGRCYDRTEERCAADGQALVFSLPVERTIDGKYRLDRLVGRGGMGAVYEAHDIRLHRRVALKVIKGSAFHSTSARRRFAREAQACARLTHPHIIRVYDYGAFENQSAYLVMEYVEGRSWRAELDRLGRFASAAAADLLDQVFDGMEAAHASGVLHRDLKPDNLMLATGEHGGAPRVKILDFGLAKVREATFTDPKSATMAGVAMGTFGYMSPEQLAAEDVDERTDVYSLGVVALETLTGKLPTFGPHFHAGIEAELNRRLLLPARTPAHVALAQAIARALALSRTRRFGSIREMRQALVPAIRLAVDMPIAAPSGTPIGDSDRTGGGLGDDRTQSAGPATTRPGPARGSDQ